MLMWKAAGVCKLGSNSAFLLFYILPFCWQTDRETGTSMSTEDKAQGGPEVLAGTFEVTPEHVGAANPSPLQATSSKGEGWPAPALKPPAAAWLLCVPTLDVTLLVGCRRSGRHVQGRRSWFWRRA